MKITETITASLNMTDITELIKESASKEGYDVVKVTPDYENQYAQDRFRDGQVIGTKLIGFKVDLKRKAQVNARTYGQFGDH